MDEMLRRAAARLSGHMPGHKGRGPFGPEDLWALDTTELPVTDDLYHPGEAIGRAQRLYARAAGAAETVFLTDGSTAGIHVMLGLRTRPGDEVLLPRASHLSAVSACVLLGLRPVWLPSRRRADGSAYVAEADVLSGIAAHPGARALLLTRPDYYGRCLPLSRVAEARRARGIFLAVDEAHGAHFPWLGEGWSAAGLADAWVQSVHKTLPGLTGSAVLHLRHPDDRPRALRLLRRVQTSSPSFLLLRSIDDARALMEAEGRQRLAWLTDGADELRARLPGWGLAEGRAGWDADGSRLDPTRLVIAAPSGGALAAALAEQGCDVEMWDEGRVVIILSAMDTPATLSALSDALAAAAHALAEGAGADPGRASSADRLVEETEAGTLCPGSAAPRAVMELREAALAPWEPVELAAAVGRVAAEAAGVYPPGIPLIVPGEAITAEIAAALIRAGEDRRFGTEGDCIPCVLR